MDRFAVGSLAEAEEDLDKLLSSGFEIDRLLEHFEPLQEEVDYNTLSIHMGQKVQNNFHQNLHMWMFECFALAAALEVHFEFGYR